RPRPKQRGANGYRNALRLRRRTARSLFRGGCIPRRRFGGIAARYRSPVYIRYKTVVVPNGQVEFGGGRLAVDRKRKPDPGGSIYAVHRFGEVGLHAGGQVADLQR